MVLSPTLSEPLLWTEFEMPSLLLVDSPRSYRRIQMEKRKFMAKGATISWLSDQFSNGAFLLLLDCRPYAEYARSHIQEAINLTIPSLMLRRLKKGTNFAISSLIASEKYKAQFNRSLRLATGIVLYDSGTSDVSSVCTNSALGVLLKKFAEDVSTPVFLLEGKRWFVLLLLLFNQPLFIFINLRANQIYQPACSFAVLSPPSRRESIRILFVFKLLARVFNF